MLCSIFNQGTILANYKTHKIIYTIHGDIMEKDKDRLNTIGKLIKVYRNELCGNSRNEYTMKNFCKNICNFNTLKTIESGSISRSDDIYEELLAKFGLKFGIFSLIDETIRFNIIDLYKAIDYLEINEIDTLTTKALRILDKVKNFVYYSELYQLIEDVRHNYLEGTMILTSRFNRYIKIIDCLEKQYKDLIILLMFKWVQYEYMDDIKRVKKFIDRFDINVNKYIPVQMILLYYYGLSSQYFKMRDLVLILEKDFIENGNQARLMDVYSYGIIMSSYTDFENVYEYIKKQSPLFDIAIIPDYKKYENYMMIGNTLHNLQDYSKASFYFEKCIKYENFIRLIDLIYLADCQNRVKQKICIPYVDKNVLMKYPCHIQIMYNYFYYFEIHDFVKENFILKEIAPNLIDDGLIKVFTYEVKRLVKLTGHYKVLYNFEKQIEDNIQSICEA